MVAKSARRVQEGDDKKTGKGVASKVGPIKDFVIADIFPPSEPEEKLRWQGRSEKS